MSSCLFCEIVKGNLNADLIYEDDLIVAFKDINPQAPFHALVIPKEHIPTLNEVDTAHAELIGRMLIVAKDLAVDAGYGQRGYRTVFNCNSEAGQAVYHIHLHVLAGRILSWPPG